MKVKLLTFVICTSIIMLSCQTTKTQLKEGIFPDKNLEKAVRNTLNKHEGQITQEDLESIIELNADKMDIRSIVGLEKCVNIQRLQLCDNPIDSITPIKGLINLRNLILEWNKTIVDIEPIANLTNLTELKLSDNKIVDISPVKNLKKLTVFFIYGNSISDLSALSELSEMTDLWLQNNQITNIDPLKDLVNIQRLFLGNNSINDITVLKYLNRIGDIEENQKNGPVLDLRNNKIGDFSSLIENDGINMGDIVDLSNNPIDSILMEKQINELEKRGVKCIISGTSGK